MKANGHINPLLLPLAGLLKQRGMRVIIGCRLDEHVHDSIRVGHPRMRELSVIAPLLAEHRTRVERRIVVAPGALLEPWRKKLLFRGINLLSVSPEGLIENASGIADKVSEHIYRIGVEELREMIQHGMPFRAIEAFTGVAASELPGIVSRFYGRSAQELRQEVGE